LPKVATSTSLLGSFTCRKARHGTDGFTSPPKEGGFFRPKIPTASAVFEPANLGTKGQHATSRPPKPLASTLAYRILCILIADLINIYKKSIIRPVDQRHVFQATTQLLFSGINFSFFFLKIKDSWSNKANWNVCSKRVQNCGYIVQELWKCLCKRCIYFTEWFHSNSNLILKL
jgi:hypothetical protein